MKGKIVVISGASAGIGEACAEIFAEAGADLVLIARRAEKLNELAGRLNVKYNIKTWQISADVRNFGKLKDAYESMPDNFKTADVLINNAGLARGMNKIQDGDIVDWDEMLDTNVKGLLYLSRIFLPPMVKAGKGLVVNIGSIAGREVYPGGNVYCASKHAVKAISKAMTIDLNGTGVKVTNIDPGLTETEFSIVRFHGDEEKADSVYKGYTPLYARDIAEVALFAATRKQSVTIQDILITPTDQASTMIINKI